MEHLTHLTLIAVGLLIGLIIWFWDSLRSRSFTNLRALTFLILIFFVLVHVSPASLLMAYHHQSQDHTTQHPCCMPQVATAVTPIIALKPLIFHENSIIAKAINQPTQIVHTINNRSPPLFS